jgi:hypothetical protein
VRKSNIILKLTGGLGNQLFIYAFYLYIKKKTTKRILFDESEFAVSFRKNRLDLLLNENISYLDKTDQFFLRPKVYRLFQMLGIFNEIITTNEIEFIGSYNSILNKSNSLCLTGYWQNSMFVNNVIEEMRSKVEIDENLKNDKYFYYLKQIKSSNSVSLHVRRSDYLLELNNTTFEILNNEYYKNAMSKFELKDTKYFVFSDDVSWCISSFSDSYPQISFIFVNLENDILEFDLMRNCKGNILANSTFSLWAGLLNEYKNKIVVAPLSYYKDPLLQCEYRNKLMFDDFIYI